MSSSVRSGTVWIGIRRLGAAALVAGLWLALGSPAASAAVVHNFVSSFNGGDVTGAKAGPFSQAGSVAVDNSTGASKGDVYVLDWGGEVVDKFTAAGAYAGVQISGASVPAGSVGAGSFSLNYPAGVAVDSSSGPNAGDVYVADFGNGVVDRFSPTGAYQCQITASATPSASECATVDHSPTPSTAPAGALAFPSGVAVDASGQVYVDDGGGVIDVFGPAGNYVRQISDPQNITGPGTIALDSSGNLYVDNAFSNVVEYGPTGVFDRVLDSNGPTAVGVDPASGHVYVAHQFPTQIVEYDSSGTQLDGFGQANAGFLLLGLAVSAASGDVYAGDLGNNSADVFTGDLVVPDVTTNPASGFTQTSATINGSVNPDGVPVSSCQFEYGTDTTYGHTIPCAQAPAQIGSGTTPVPVSANVSGLRAGTVYHFRLDAGNTSGQNQSGDVTLGTLPPAGTPTPQWETSVLGVPTNFPTKSVKCQGFFGSGVTNPAAVDCQQYVIMATNVGDAPSDGADIALTDTLPAGVTATSIELYTPYTIPFPQNQQDFGPADCTQTPASGPVRCVYSGSMPPIAPDQFLRMVVHVTVDHGTTGTLTNSASASGGGATDASASTVNQVADMPASYAIPQLGAQLLNADGTPSTQAGAHPYELRTSINVPTEEVALGAISNQGLPQVFLDPVEDPKDLTVDLPPGLVGDPQAVPQCPDADFTAKNSFCPVDSQVGVVTTELAGADTATEALHPLYNLTPGPGAAAALGFTVAGIPTVLTAGLRTGGDYGVRTTDAGVPKVDVLGAAVTIWGVPADPRHDPLRETLAGEHNSTECDLYTGCHGDGASSGLPLRPFLTNPTDCSAGTLTLGASSDSWEHQGAFQTASATLPAMAGCQALSFDPTISVAPDTSQAGAPAGLGVEIKVPQTDDPKTLATSEARDVTVALPAGMAVNPSSAGGLGSCSDAQIAVSSPDAASCPDSSKIGTVLLHTPLLDHPLSGDVYVGQPQCSPCSPADAAAGRMVRLFIQVDDPQTGVIVKLQGSVAIDQSTGQLTTSFLQNPQLPFDDLQLSLKGGARAPLVNPTSCGTFTATSDFVPWGSPLTIDATPSSAFDINGCGDPNTFAPSFTAGVQNPQAGSYSHFVLSFQRSDADQQFSGLSVSLPPGLSAKLAGVPLCSDSDANAGTCPASSQVGTVEAGSGAGSEPLFLPGAEYLTGPYKGGPYGLVVEVPAIAGPYNLGTVVVRQALYIDPTTAQVTVVSDPFPQTLDGIPLRLRRVDVSIDRPNFTINPTTCDPMQIGGTMSSTGGMTAPVSSRFQVGGCQGLGFAPRLQFKLTGNGQTHSGNHPTLTATLTQGGGQANIRSAKVALPLSLALDINNSQHVCNYDTAQAVHGGAVGCPASTIVGQATAVTPLLSQPLSGPVYLVQGIRFGKNGQRIHTLPSLLVPLRGQIAIDLRASSAVNGAQQLVTTFNTIPDAPVNKFSLTINGGRKGLLVITGRGKTICGASQVANSDFGAQSGKADNQNDTMATPCARVAHRKRHLRRHIARKHSRRR